MNQKIGFFILSMILAQWSFAKCNVYIQSLPEEEGSLKIYFDAHQESWSGSRYAYWDFGDGTQDSIEYDEATHDHEIVHQFPNFGRYLVYLRVECEEGQLRRSYDLWLTEGDSIPTCNGQYSYTLTPSTQDSELQQLQLHLSEPFEGVVNWWQGYAHRQGNPVEYDIRYPGDYPLLLTAANQEEYTFCQDTLKLDFEVDFKADFEVVYGFQVVQFRDRSWGKMNVNSWDFGNGFTAENSPNSHHRYSETGEYQACLFSYEPILNQRDTLCQIVQIQCREEFTYQPDEDYSNVVHFQVPKTGMNSPVYVDFGDGNIEELTSPSFSHTYEDTQELIEVCMWELNEECSNTACQVLDFPISTFCEAYFKTRPIGKGMAFFFEGSFSHLSENATKQWLYYSHSSMEEGDNFVLRSLREGYTNVACVVETEDHCRAEHTKEIYLKQVNDEDAFLPAPCFSIETTSNSMTYHFNNHTPTATSYSWHFGDGHTSDLETPIHDYAQTGFYEVCLTAFNEDTVRNKLVSESFCDWLNIGEIDTCVAKFIPISEMGNMDVDMDGEIKFYNLSYLQSDATWLWDFGDGTTSKEFQPRHLFPYSDTFEVCLTVSKPQGCEVQYCEEIFYGCGLQLETTYLSESDQLLITYKNKSHINGAYYVNWRINNHGVGTTDQSEGNFLVNHYTDHEEYGFVFGDTIEVCAYNYEIVSDCNVICQNIVVDSTTTSIKPFSKTSPTIHIFPNPFSDYTTIEVEGLPPRSYQLQVMDILGRKVRELRMDGDELILNRGELESGLYLIQVVEEGSGEVLGSGKVLVE